MQIEVTGCNNCPFALYNSCVMFNNVPITKGAPVLTLQGEYVHFVPHNCPITINGGEITIKTKTE